MNAVHLIAAALALASLGMAAPVLAQSAAAKDETTARFLALKDPLIANIGIADTVILFYISFDGDLADPGFDLGVYYLTPGGKTVRIQGVQLGPVVGQLFRAAVDSYRADPDFRSAALVIDHGEASVTVRRTPDFDAATPFRKRLDAEVARVFPGVPVEPYRAPGS